MSEDRDRIMGALEPPGSYGLCWKPLPDNLKCVLAIDHTGDCSTVEPQVLAEPVFPVLSGKGRK